MKFCLCTNKGTKSSVPTYTGGIEHEPCSWLSGPSLVLPTFSQPYLEFVQAAHSVSCFF